MTKFNRSPIQAKLYTKSHRQKGSQIAELPPALILLFFVFLFPLINLFYIFSAFAAGWYLNSIELREVACSLPSSILPLPANPPDQQFHNLHGILPQSVNWNGMFGVTEDSNSPQVAQFPPVGNPNIVATSIVKTTVNIKPLIAFQNVGTILPLGNVPGLGKPFTFTYTGQIEQEEPGP